MYIIIYIYIYIYVVSCTSMLLYNIETYVTKLEPFT